MRKKWLFCAYYNELLYIEKKPYFSKEFSDFEEMKVFSAKHSNNEKSAHPGYVSMYWEVPSKNSDDKLFITSDRAEDG